MPTASEADFEADSAHSPSSDGARPLSSHASTITWCWLVGWGFVTVTLLGHKIDTRPPHALRPHLAFSYVARTCLRSLPKGA